MAKEFDASDCARHLREACADFCAADVRFPFAEFGFVEGGSCGGKW